MQNVISFSLTAQFLDSISHAEVLKVLLRFVPPGGRHYESEILKYKIYVKLSPPG